MRPSERSGPHTCGPGAGFSPVIAAIAGLGIVFCSCAVVGGSDRHAERSIGRYLRLDTVEIVDRTLEGDREDVIVHGREGEWAMYLPRYAASRTEIRLFRGGRGEQREVRLPIPTGMEVSERAPLNDFAMLGDSAVVVLAFKRLLLYRASASGWVCSRQLSLENAYASMFIDGDQCTLYECAYSAGGTEPGVPRIATVDIRSLTLMRTSRIEPPSGAQFMLFQPRSVMSVSRRWVAVGDIDRYRIRLFDRALDLQTEIRREPTDWVQIDDLNATTPVGLSAKQIIAALRPASVGASLLEHVAFLNDSVLLIAYTMPATVRGGIRNGRADVRYDLWKYGSGRWQLLDTDLRNANPDFADSITRESGMPVSRRFVCEHDVLVSAEPIPVPVFGRAWQEVAADVEAYLADHDLRLSIVIQNWRIP